MRATRAHPPTTAPPVVVVQDSNKNNSRSTPRRECYFSRLRAVMMLSSECTRCVCVCVCLFGWLVIGGLVGWLVG